MKGWIIKILAAILIWVIVALIVGFLGGLLVTVDSKQVVYVGEFMEKTASLIGFLCGAAWLVWGKQPT